MDRLRTCCSSPGGAGLKVMWHSCRNWPLDLWGCDPIMSVSCLWEISSVVSAMAEEPTARLIWWLSYFVSGPAGPAGRAMTPPQYHCFLSIAHVVLWKEAFFSRFSFSPCGVPLSFTVKEVLMHEPSSSSSSSSFSGKFKFGCTGDTISSTAVSSFSLQATLMNQSSCVHCVFILVIGGAETLLWHFFFYC